MAHYHVARMTARQAIQELRGEGRVVSEQGRGVFVRQPLPVRRLASERFASERFARQHREAGLAAFSADAVKAGFTPDVDQIEVSRELPPPDIRKRLRLPDNGPAVVRSRRYLADGRPVETAVSYIPADIADGTRIAELDTGPGGIYARLEEIGHVRSRSPAGRRLSYSRRFALDGRPTPLRVRSECVGAPWREELGWRQQRSPVQAKVYQRWSAEGLALPASRSSWLTP